MRGNKREPFFEPPPPGAIVEHGGGTYAPVRGVDDAFAPWGPAAPGLPSAPQIQLSLAMLLRRKWLIVGVTVLVAAVSIPPIWLLIEPKYQARATVRVAPVIPRLLYKYEDNGLVPLYQSFLETQVALIHNPVILDRVLDDREVQATAWYRHPPRRFLRDPLPPLERLMQDMSAGPRRGTELIDIGMSTKDPADAKLIADKICSHYLNHTDVDTEKIDQMQLSVLTDKQNELRSSIEGMIRTRNVIVNKLGTAEPGQIRTRVAARLVELEEQQTTLEMERDLNRWRLEYLKQASAEQQKELADASGDPRPAVDRFKPRFEDDRIWQDRRLGLETAQHQLNLARDHFGEGHPRIKELSGVVELNEKLLRQRETELSDPRATPMPVLGNAPTGQELQTYDPASIERAIAEAEFRQQQIEKAIDEQRRQVEDINEKAQTIERLDQEIAVARGEAESVRERLSVLRMEKKAARELGRVSLASSAVLPSEPYRDRRALLTMLMLVFSVGIGMGVGLMRAMMDSSVREARDVRGTVSIPFLGYLPKVRQVSTLLESTDGPLHESVRMIRTALLDRVPVGRGFSVVVTSPGPQAGKTSVAILLARSLKRVGKKVLLVDADLRRPSLSGRLGIKADKGLSDLLAGRASDQDVIVIGADENVDVLPAGASGGRDDAELMANGVFSECLGRWQKRYDFVLFDAPPVLPVADARILASQVDGAILTLRAAHCRRAEAVEAIEQLGAAGGRTLGTILVGAERDLSYGGQGYY